MFRLVVGGAAVTVPTVVGDVRVVELRLVVTAAELAVVGRVLVGLTVVGFTVVGFIVVGLTVVGLAVVDGTGTTVDGVGGVIDGLPDDEGPTTVVPVVGVTDPVVAGVEVGTETESDVVTELGVVTGRGRLDEMLGAAAVALRRTVVGTLI